MAGRTMVLSRKGGGSGTSAPETKGDNNDNGGDRTDAQGGTDDGAPDNADDMTCPQCGCEFDAATGKIMNDGDYDEPGKDTNDGKDGKSQPKGVALEIAAPTPDAQAPTGEDAITRAIAAALAGGH